MDIYIHPNFSLPIYGVLKTPLGKVLWCAIVDEAREGLYDIIGTHYYFEIYTLEENLFITTVLCYLSIPTDGEKTLNKNSFGGQLEIFVAVLDNYQIFRMGHTILVCFKNLRSQLWWPNCGSMIIRVSNLGQIKAH